MPRSAPARHPFLIRGGRIRLRNPQPNYAITSLKSAEYWGNCSAANCYSVGVWPGGQKQLRCEVEGEESLSVFSFAATHPKHYRCEQVTVRLESLFESDSVVDLTALGVDDLCHIVVPPLGIKTIRVMQERGLPFADTCHTAEIGVLVGADYYWKVVTGNVESLATDLIAVETIFGWIVQNVGGPVRGTISSLVSVFFLAHEDQDHFESIDPSEMWRLDALGIADHVAGDDDSVASLCFSSQVEKRNSRYVVPLMVKGSGLPAEANNRVTAAQRLVAQFRRFRTSPQLLLNYDSVIREYFDEGHAERVADVSIETDNVYYMPHHAVIRKDAVTTKLRVVFDASSHCPGQPSLNSLLMKGPKLNADLIHLLLVFRCSTVVLTADIRKAYLQISSIRTDDRDLLRFLWVQDVAAHESPQIEEWRMTRVPFGATSSPFLLAATLQHHLASVASRYPMTVPRLCTGFYVDDLVVGCTSEPDALQVYGDTIDILQEAGMDIRKWTSNSSALRERFLSDEVSYDNASDGNAMIKVLGLLWDRDTDSLTFSVKRALTLSASHPPTKRTVLKTFSLIYDPLGYLAPFIVTVKLLFQNSKALLDVHCFADASPKAYGTTVYVRSRPNNGTTSTRLLLARARLAPLKELSLPRLELLACLLSTRLYRHISTVEALKVAPIHFWTDSSIALQWIQCDTNTRPSFVKSMVAKILSSSRPEQWRHCNGRDNPADLVTCGISARCLRNSPLWWSGPPWLSAGDISPPTIPDPNVNDTCTTVSAAPEAPDTEVVVHPVSATQNWMDLSAYSTLSRLLRVTAWCARFVRNSRPRQPCTTGPLTSEELRHAETIWVSHVQTKAFRDDILALRHGSVAATSSSVRVFQPFLDASGILRVGGRLHQLQDSYQIKHPILLPPKHRFTELIILDAHQRLLHAGVQDTIAEV
ncbi:uncharacterized protein LOC135372307 [Ornithodoros turicata]|uniref:uncharacterized protein LOC135372307 n=1 Tax=Ornithodoros turicata TaxID=34597 RepID=UPI003138A1CA